MTNANYTNERADAIEALRADILSQLDDLLEGHADDPNDRGSLLARRVARLREDVINLG